MPIFEFHCTKCGIDFEELVLSRSEKIACPKCACKKVSKRMSTFAHHKGGSSGAGDYSSPSGGSGGSSCGSCSGGSCSTCH
jgi:putative FmdB family regulatory protein